MNLLVVCGLVGIFYLFPLILYFSDAMETDDKVGSSPAGKATDAVIMISLIFKGFYFF